MHTSLEFSNLEGVHYKKVEKAVASHLKQQGYKIEYLNWTCHWGEIDIVAKQGNKFVFVEVKYRSSNYYGFGHESVNRNKKMHLLRSIQWFLIQEAYDPGNWRFDVAIVTKSRGKNKLKYYENVEFS